MPTIHTDLVRNPTQANRERFLLFAISVAGKQARVISQKVRDFLALEPNTESPFEALANMVHSGRLDENLQAVRLGQYDKLGRAFRYLARTRPDLTRITPDKLEDIPGVGPKTARYVLMYVQDRDDIAVLDTHTLRYLREHLGHEAPHATPSSRTQYRRWERIFVDHARELGISPRRLDDVVWNHYSTGTPLDLPDPASLAP